MTSGPCSSDRGAAALACCLAALVLLAAGEARAEFKLSRHDFVQGPQPMTTAPVGGACGACHIPHKAEPFLLWARPLGSSSAFAPQNVAFGYSYNPSEAG